MFTHEFAQLLSRCTLQQATCIGRYPFPEDDCSFISGKVQGCQLELTHDFV